MSFRGTTTEQSRKVSGQSEDEILKKLLLHTSNTNLEAFLTALLTLVLVYFKVSKLPLFFS